jgi:hypothetical protein
MTTREWKIEDSGWNARSVLECGGKRSATPLSGLAASEPKRRRRCALPAHSTTWRLWLVCFCFLLSAFYFRAWGQSYSIDWYKISGGGGTSTGATYQVTGTIGQPEAGSTMSGGQYSLTGGFWGLIAVVQTAGAPRLTITRSVNSVTVSWPVGSGGFVLQQNNNLANPASWSPYGGTVNTANGVSSITLTSPTGTLFFRLKTP